jgi:hypothetical protein
MAQSSLLPVRVIDSEAAGNRPRAPNTRKRFTFTRAARGSNLVCRFQPLRVRHYRALGVRTVRLSRPSSRQNLSAYSIVSIVDNAAVEDAPNSLLDEF